MTITNHKLKEGFLKTTIIKMVSILIILSYSPLSTAFIIGVISGSPQGSNTIKDNQVNTTRIIWSGASDSSGSNTPGQPYSVFSSEGRFIIGNTIVATNARRIAATLIASNLTTTPAAFTIRETLRIPRSVLVAAKQSNTSFIQYIREFTDESGGPDVSSVTTFQITNSSSGVLSLSQIDLRFDNKNLTKVIKQGDALSAYAAINYSGNGLLQAAWEIATPISTSSTPIFTRLKTIRQFLGTRRNIIIESPSLPNNLIGNYILRLRITSPTDVFDNLQLRYSVIPSNTPTIELQKIIITSPLKNSVIDENTLFNWQPIKGANTYQIEIYETDNTNLPNFAKHSSKEESKTHKFSSGILLTSEKTSSKLTKLSLQHLKKGRSYRWRTVAINKDGFIVGKSTYHQIRLKP